MFATTIAGLRVHARRMVATIIAVMLGVAFTVGTLVFGATAHSGFFDAFARPARGVDIAVLPPDSKADRVPPTLTSSQLTSVRSLPGVASAAGRMQAPLGLLSSDGKLVTNFGQTGVAIATDGISSLRGFDLVGGVPVRAGEAALDRATAAHQHVAIGDEISVVDATGNRRPLRLVGLLDFGASKQYTDESVVDLTPSDFAALTGTIGYAQIVAAATNGASTARLSSEVRRVVGARPQVLTGNQWRTKLANDATSAADQLQFVLLIFGVVSLIVAAFVIYNTFAILLAQRVRETALLRCVGASRRQVFASALGEAAAVGLAGGVVGVGVGVGFAAGFLGLMNGVGFAAVPVHGIVLTPTPVIVGLLLGLVVTVAAAVAPTARAARTSPMTALRDVPLGRGNDRGSRSRRRLTVRLAVGLACSAIGVAITVAGVHNPQGKPGTFEVVAGGVLTFLAVLVWAPLFIGALTRAVGAVPARLFGTPARLATLNARWNPGRTAVTSTTLMIAIGLMALFSVVLASVRQTATDQITGHYPVDYLMTGIGYGDGRRAPVPAEYAARLQALPQFSGVAEVRVGHGTIDGKQAIVAATDPDAYGHLVTPDMVTGRAADLVAGTAIVNSGNRSAHIGGTLVVTIDGHPKTLRIVGTAKTNVPDVGTADALISWDDAAALYGTGDDTVVMAKSAPGVSAVASRDALDALDTAYPLITVDSIADLTDSLNATVNGLIVLFVGLLGTAVVIALFGIANTLSLSVVERTRESAMMRALGLTRNQLRATLLVEAVLMGIVGALVGVAYGLAYGPLVVRAAFQAIGPTVVVPWTWLIALTVLAAVAAGLAAVIPARRAARTSIVASLAES